MTEQNMTAILEENVVKKTTYIVNSRNQRARWPQL